jgi:hypothetical protein
MAYPKDDSKIYEATIRGIISGGDHTLESIINGNFPDAMRIAATNMFHGEKALQVQATASAAEVREKIENVGIAIVDHDVRKYISQAAALTTNGHQK